MIRRWYIIASYDNVQLAFYKIIVALYRYKLVQIALQSYIIIILYSKLHIYNSRKNVAIFPFLMAGHVQYAALIEQEFLHIQNA